MNTGKLIFINYSDAPAKGTLPLKAVGSKTAELIEEFSGEKIYLSPEMQAQGLSVHLQPYQCKIFSYSL